MEHLSAIVRCECGSGAQQHSQLLYPPASWGACQSNEQATAYCAANWKCPINEPGRVQAIVYGSCPTGRQ